MLTFSSVVTSTRVGRSSRSTAFVCTVPRRQATLRSWPDADTRFGFQRCEVTEAGIEVTFEPGNDQSEEFDSYGPWGHPTIEERDYSVAREQPPLIPDR